MFYKVKMLEIEGVGDEVRLGPPTFYFDWSVFENERNIKGWR